MKKYILTETGKEVKVGDKITLPKSMVYAIFGGHTDVQILLTEEVIPMLVGFHIINSYSSDIKYYIEKAAKYFDFYTDDMEDLIEILRKKMPLVAIQILLRIMSIEFTKDVNLAKLNKVYGISLYDGKIFTLNKCNNYRIAWFDTEDKAKLALKILKPYMEKIYGK